MKEGTREAEKSKSAGRKTKMVNTMSRRDGHSLHALNRAMSIEGAVNDLVHMNTDNNNNSTSIHCHALPHASGSTLWSRPLSSLRSLLFLSPFHHSLILVSLLPFLSHG
jgi:hypothetical protein